MSLVIFVDMAAYSLLIWAAKYYACLDWTGVPVKVSGICEHDVWLYSLQVGLPVDLVGLHLMIFVGTIASTAPRIFMLLQTHYTTLCVRMKIQQHLDGNTTVSQH